jgi:CelD/BcsL family acetyltransferase involved in cellulose biosynthesis
MEVRRIDRIEEFRALCRPWDELVGVSDLDAVFLRHAWFDAWIRAYAAEERLAIETLWRAGRLAAIAPLQRTTQSFRGVRVRALELLWSAVAPRSGWIATRDEDVAALLDGLLERDDWDVLVAPNWPTDAATGSALLDAVRRAGLAHQDVPGFRSPFLRIRGTWDEYWAGLPRERRRYLTKKCTNRLEREGDHEFRRIDTAEALEAFVPEMYALSEKSWKAGISAELRPDSPVAQLLVGFARDGLEAGRVRVETLRLHDELIAFEYMLVGSGRHSVVRSDYDLAYRYFTPGNSLRLHVLQQLFAEGATEYDLGGDPHPYKLEWCDTIRDHRTLTVANRTWRGRLVLGAKTVLLPALRRLRGAADPGAAA